MKNDRKIFILIEVMLAMMVMVTALMVLYENTNREIKRVSVILQNSEAQKWASLKYGLRMAAKDEGIDLHIVSNESDISVEEQEQMIEHELYSGSKAIIIQPIIAEGEEEMLNRMSRKTDMMLIGAVSDETEMLKKIPVTQVDQYVLGKVLAEAMLSDYTGSLENKRLGIVSRVDKSFAIGGRRQGFLDAIADKGAVLVWEITHSFSKDEWNIVTEQDAVDIVIALDDDSLVGVSALSAEKNLHGALIYGIGHSMEAVYYLDTGIVRCLTVPDTFNVGYQSLISVLNKKDNIDFKDDYYILRRDNLFTKRNQELIFTMSQ